MVAFPFQDYAMARCKLCKVESIFTPKELGVCGNCIKKNPGEALPIARQAHQKSRAAFSLPEEPPKDPGGIPCGVCVNECRIAEGGLGYCGLRRNEGGNLSGISPEDGKLSWYHDPLPSNCVADWVCPGGTGAAYPEWAHSSGPEYGYKNLAVFFHACSFNCLHCQNWHFRQETLHSHTIPPKNLISEVDEKTSCICYFGGDPSPQLPFAIQASRRVLAEKKGRILRICWETNGSMHSGLLDEMINLALNSGGCIKFDLKAWDDNLHIALTGVTNRRTIENFSRAGEKIGLRSAPPLLIASTLLVPGYIDENEIRSIARFIASIDSEIPYCLLAFYPHFYMSDLPLTKQASAQGCLQAAREEGLQNVRIGNLHLLR